MMAVLTARDMGTVTGRNMRLIETETGLDLWVATPTMVRETLRVRESVSIPEEDQWRVPYLQKLLEQRQQLHYREEEEEVKKL